MYVLLGTVVDVYPVVLLQSASEKFRLATIQQPNAVYLPSLESLATLRTFVHLQNKIISSENKGEVNRIVPEPNGIRPCGLAAEKRSQLSFELGCIERGNLTEFWLGNFLGQ